MSFLMIVVFMLLIVIAFVPTIFDVDERRRCYRRVVACVTGRPVPPQQDDGVDQVRDRSSHAASARQGGLRYVLSPEQEEEIRNAFLTDRLQGYTMKLDAVHILDKKEDAAISTTDSSESDGHRPEEALEFATIRKTPATDPTNHPTSSRSVCILQMDEKCHQILCTNETLRTEKAASEATRIDAGVTHNNNGNNVQECAIIANAIDDNAQGDIEQGLSVSNDSPESTKDPTSPTYLDVVSTTTISFPSRSESDNQEQERSMNDYSSHGDDSGGEECLYDLQGFDACDEEYGGIRAPLPGAPLSHDKLHHVDIVNDKNYRVYSNGCSICLSSFVVGDDISWSHNPQCSHVFHTDCIRDWLVAAGRKHMQRYQRRSRRGNRTRIVLRQDPITTIMRMPLLCPCCRQAFLWHQEEPKSLKRQEQLRPASGDIEQASNRAVPLVATRLET